MNALVGNSGTLPVVVGICGKALTKLNPKILMNLCELQLFPIDNGFGPHTFNQLKLSTVTSQSCRVRVFRVPLLVIRKLSSHSKKCGKRPMLWSLPASPHSPHGSSWLDEITELRIWSQYLLVWGQVL